MTVATIEFNTEIQKEEILQFALKNGYTISFKEKKDKKISKKQFLDDFEQSLKEFKNG